MSVTTVKVLPWGGEIYKEIPLHFKSANKFYARHGKTAEGREYLEFTKFGPIPNTEGENYHQKLRLFSPVQWLQIKHYVEHELAPSIGWNFAVAQEDFMQLQEKMKTALLASKPTTKPAKHKTETSVAQPVSA